MNDNLKMLMRYGVSIVTAYVVGKGWLTSDQASGIGNLLIEAVGWGVVAIPPVWALFKVSNQPKGN